VNRIVVRVALLVSFCGGVLLVGWIAAACFWQSVRCDGVGECDQIPFDPMAWQDEDQVRPPAYIRIRMIDDLMHRNIRGMRRSAVDALLGPPTDTDHFREYDYVYWLGPERGLLGVDSEWLGIKFDRDIVVEAILLRD